MPRDDLAALWEFVSFIGQAISGEAWDGTEVNARDKIGIAAMPFTVGRPPPPPTIRNSSGPFSPGGDAPMVIEYKLYAADGLRTYTSKAEADDAWLAERPKIEAAIERERQARSRYLKARAAARARLARGEFVALILATDTGMKFPVPADFWDSDAALDAFENQASIAAVPMLTPDKSKLVTIKGRVFLWRDHLAADNAPPKSPVDGTAKPKRGGGAPSGYDWERLIAALIEHADLHGFANDTFADVVRWAETWCDQHFASPPGSTTVRERVERYVKHIERAQTRPKKARKTGDSSNSGGGGAR